MRILHAPKNIAGQAWAISAGQKRLGYRSDTCVYSRFPFDYPCDISLELDQVSSLARRRLTVAGFFLKSLFSYDIFHFHFGRSLLGGNRDLPILKRFGKKVVMHYWGSDVRRRSLVLKNNPLFDVPMRDERAIVRDLQRHAKYVDVAVVADRELCAHVEGFSIDVRIIPQAVQLECFEVRLPSLHEKCPTVVHAPTDRGIKGTRYVLEAVEQLKSDGHEFDFLLLEGRRAPEVKAIVLQADIIIDQVLGGAYGVSAIEAMAMGKPVLCYIREDMRAEYPTGLPIPSTSPLNIYRNLEVLLTDPNLRRDLGRQGRRYVEEVHDALKIAVEFIELYRSI